MISTLFHIYGPFSVHSYGVAIVCGLLLFIWLTNRDSRRAQVITSDQYNSVLVLGIASALVGGRALYVFDYWHDFESFTDIFALWQGGLAVLGSILGVLALVPWYLKKIGVPIIPFFDLMALYTPLLQSISRIGCFFAGCCYGSPTHLPWGVTYTNHETTLAYSAISLHPTQLYSSFILFGIFVVLYFNIQHKITKPGQLFASYLMLMSIERFVVDIFRGDRHFYSHISSDFFSSNQLIALAIFLGAGIYFVRITWYRKRA